jgi:hypothetical protein
VTYANLTNLERQPGRGPSGARAMTKVAKLEIADFGVTDGLFKGMAQSASVSAFPNKKLAGSDFGVNC